MLDKVDFDQAKRLILENTTELDHELVDLPDADGRVFYEDIYSDENIPPFSRSPFDGYALIASDTAGATNKTPVKLSLLEEIPAGSVGKKNVIPGYAAKILTGAPIPDGADLVVKFEDVVFDEKSVTISRAYLPGNICPAGEDIKKGDLIVEVDLEGVKNAGFDVVTPIIIYNSGKFSKIEKKTGSVSAGDTVILLAK